jgi:UDP-2-acetamido-2-deoxy-ribo-hexuluronate aminotransferase
VLTGATPVFADIDPVTCNIDPDLVERLVTAKTRAIIPVSLFGQTADMDALNAIALRHGLAVIEDAAQSFGASYRGQRSCNLSTIGCTSFFPSKPLGCYGDGGALFTSNDELARAMREIRVHGQSRRYVHTRVGVGGRMDTLQCAIVLAKLPRFAWEIQQRKRAAACYDALLAGHVALVGRARGHECVFAQYTVFVEDRACVQSALNAEGIPTAVHYPLPIHHQPAYVHISKPGSCPVATRLADSVLSLPMGPYLSDSDTHKVAEALLRATGKAMPGKPELAMST